jgi:hypothetical protein
LLWLVAAGVVLCGNASGVKELDRCRPGRRRSTSSERPQPHGTGAGIGASESTTIGCQHSPFDQRTEDAFAPCGLEAEETRGLGERQPHSWHFAELRRYTRLKCG